MPTLANPVIHAAGPDSLPAIRTFLTGAEETILRVLSSRDALLMTSQADGDIDGVSCWSPIPWDSAMYGFPAARLDFLITACDPTRRRLLEATLSRARDRGIRHMIARVDAGNLALTLTLNRSGFELIDGIQTFTLTLPHSLRPTANVHTRLYEPADLGQILSLARTAYTFDRFHADPAIDNSIADRINEEWLRNSCSGPAADAVLVAVDGPEVLGYATCKIDRNCPTNGTIVMVATAAHARRRGVAAACTHAAVEWFQRRDVTQVHVGTQLRNIPAARLYERCGFHISANSLTWRILL